MDDASFEQQVPDDELEAVRLQLAGLGQEPLPGDVATRLDARLAAELSATPLAARRSRRRRLRVGASLSAAAAVAAAVVFALSTGGGGHPAPEASALQQLGRSVRAGGRQRGHNGRRGQERGRRDERRAGQEAVPAG